MNPKFTGGRCLAPNDDRAKPPCDWYRRGAAPTAERRMAALETNRAGDAIAVSVYSTRVCMDM